MLLHLNLILKCYLEKRDKDTLLSSSQSKHASFLKENKDTLHIATKANMLALFACVERGTLHVSSLRDVTIFVYMYIGL